MRFILAILFLVPASAFARDAEADAAAAFAFAKLARERKSTAATDTGDDAPTPHEEIARVLALLPKPTIGFVDYGCGDARWCIAAAERWGCRAVGVEIDPARAAAAKERVRASGLDRLVTIIEGDAITTDVQADVGVVYLWPEVLEKLKPRLEKLKAFASYMHTPPVAGAVKNGDSWIYIRPQPVAVTPTTATWGNRQYTGPLCNSPNCAMCQSIRAQLSTPSIQATPAATVQSSGHYVKHCSNGKCWYEWVQDN